jgi:hypothetical protein
MVKPRPGIEILEDVPGTGERLERHHFYRMSLKMWLNKGDAIKWTRPFGILGESTISPDGHTLTADYRVLIASICSVDCFTESKACASAANGH